MSIRVVCLSGLLALFAMAPALPAPYADTRPPPTSAQYLPHRHINHLNYQLKMMWRREERAHLHAMPRVQRRGWIRAEWSRMSDQPPPRDATTKARQGETTGVVRWVLGISLTLVIVGMVVAFLVF